jgi:transcriptional repressor NrdR
MKCPFCASDQLIVTNSRPTNNELEIWRRRKCLRCGGLLTTHEKIDLSFITVIKRSGKRVKYNRAKLYSGIYQAIAATKKLDRGTAGDISEKIMQIIEKEIIGQKSREMTSENIFKITANILKNYYPDSCLRYIAYFSKTKDLQDLILGQFNAT